MDEHKHVHVGLYTHTHTHTHTHMYLASGQTECLHSDHLKPSVRWSEINHLTLTHVTAESSLRQTGQSFNEF